MLEDQQNRPTIRLRGRPTTRDWENVDWRRGSPEIAEEMGVTLPYTCKRRARHAPETVGKFKAPRKDAKNIDFSEGIDWTRGDNELSSELGCHPSWVNRHRAIYAPETYSPRGNYLTRKTLHLIFG